MVAAPVVPRAPVTSAPRGPGRLSLANAVADVRPAVPKGTPERNGSGSPFDPRADRIAGTSWPCVEGFASKAKTVAWRLRARLPASTVAFVAATALGCAMTTLETPIVPAGT